MSRYLKFFAIDGRDILVALGALASLFAFIPIFTYVYFAKDLDNKESIMNRNDTGLILLDAKNRPFFTFYEAKQREVVPMSQISDWVKKSVIASEDKEFYNHDGFSVRGIVRSIYLNFTGNSLTYGGSTITQQLVKNSLLSNEKSFLRKYQELVLSQEIERRYSKDEILEMYLNSAYFGEGSFGIEQAAETYFNKDAKDLGLEEAALLAGLLPAPSRFSPFNGSVDESRLRQKIILEELEDQGQISMKEKEEALEKKLVFNTPNNDLNKAGAHFALMVRKELADKYGEEKVSRSGFKVRTTLDLDFQQEAEKIVAEHVERLKRNMVSNGAAVVMDPRTGEIKALVGSKSWNADGFGKINMAIAPRQPGSAFKPIVYAQGLEKRLITASTVLMDNPTTFKAGIGQPTYKPQNYDRKFRGPVLVRRALANSLNIPAVEVMTKLGVDEVLGFAKRMGISTLKDPSFYGPSLVLGTGEVPLVELAGAYGVFANNGLRVPPVVIEEIIDKGNNVVYKKEIQPERVLGEEEAFIISSILADNQARAEMFGNALTITRTAAVKTGTTDDYKDAWTVGYTPSIVVGVWVGNSDNKSMDRVAGSLGAAPIWKALIEKYLANTAREEFKPPSGVLKASVCKSNGFLLKEATSSGYSEYFIKGTEPKKPCTLPSPSANPVILTPQTTPNRDDKKEEKKDDLKDDIKQVDSQKKNKQGYIFNYIGV